jgi:phage shock protein E
MNKALTLLLAALVFYGVPSLASERAEVGWQWIEQGALIVDVRTPQEFESGHLDNAVNYPLSQLATHFANMDKDQKIVLYCRSGNRSGQAYQYLRSQGFTNLHNAGGLAEIQNAQ